MNETNAKRMAAIVVLMSICGMTLAFGGSTIVTITEHANTTNGLTTVSLNVPSSFTLSPGQQYELVLQNATLDDSSGSIINTGTSGILTLSAPNSSVTAINTNTLLGCGGIYVAPAGYNAVVRAPNCKTNLNLTIQPSSQKQVFLDTAANQVITVNAISPWNFNVTCYNNYNSTVSYYNQTFNAIFTCKKDSLNVTFNVTPSANTVIPFVIAGKPVGFYGTRINDSSHGIVINAFYPQLNEVNHAFEPNSLYSVPAANLSIETLPNDAFFNISQANADYLTLYGPGVCYHGFYSGNQFVCLQQTATSKNLSSVCAEQFILDQNASEGMYQCVINFHATDSANDSVLSNTISADNLVIQNNEPYLGHNATYWYGQYDTLKNSSIPWNVIIIAIAAIIITGMLADMYRKRRGPIAPPRK